MNWFFLQVTNPATTTAAADSLQKANAAATSAHTMNVMDLLANGGPIMITLGLLFVLSVFFFFERLSAIRKLCHIDPNFVFIIRDNVFSGNVSAARSMAKNTHNPV